MVPLTRQQHEELQDTARKEGDSSSKELLTKGGIAMVTSLEMTNERAKKSKLGPGRKAVNRDGLFAWEGTRKVKGKKL